MNIKITPNPTPKPKPDVNGLQFGKVFTDHMFIMDYYGGQGWVEPRIVPYGPIELDPSCKVLHYGQEVFEGMKAYRHADGSPVLFRPEMNFRRLNISCQRMCIPAFDEAMALEATRKLVELDADWIPDAPGTSLYIRPFIFGADNALGIGPSEHLIFLIICSPVASIFGGNMAAVNILVETELVRAVRGGTGFAKTGGNYAASLLAAKKAQVAGFSQVLWLDGVERRYIEEVGAMNIFFRIDDEIITPSLDSGSILPGITRDSCIQLLRSRGHAVTERRIAIDELCQHMRDGRVREIFGSGTAAVVTPVGGIQVCDEFFTINDGKSGEVTTMLYNTLTGIQTGKVADEFGWVVRV